MQATKSLVLKAVADAQKSVASSRPKVVVEPKEEETEHKLELQKQLSKLQEEFRMNKERLERECGGKVDEYEDYK